MMNWQLAAIRTNFSSSMRRKVDVPLAKWSSAAVLGSYAALRRLTQLQWSNTTSSVSYPSIALVKWP